MSKFLSKDYLSIKPYVPGEQPKIDSLIKLNTNESPFPPSNKAIEEATKVLNKLNLYPDPECTELRKTFASKLTNNLTEKNIIVGNGSDEILYLAFMSFKDNGFVFCDITYGFYEVYAKISGAKYKEIPLKKDYTIDIESLINSKENIVIANPNAPTGIAISLKEIERIISSNRNRLVIVDEAYVDFGADSAINLVEQYDNLLIVQTFSKSRSLAGARVGFGIANEEIIKDLNLYKYSLNPYNINKISLALACGVINDEEYTQGNISTIITTREYTVEALKNLGFDCLNSKSNFIFVKNDKISGFELYTKLRQRKILVRYFDKDRLREYVRITIGSKNQMEKLIEETKNILEELK